MHRTLMVKEFRRKYTANSFWISLLKRCVTNTLMPRSWRTWTVSKPADWTSWVIELIATPSKEWTRCSSRRMLEPLAKTSSIVSLTDPYQCSLPNHRHCNLRTKIKWRVNLTPSWTRELWNSHKIEKTLFWDCKLRRKVLLSNSLVRPKSKLQNEMTTAVMVLISEMSQSISKRRGHWLIFRRALTKARLLRWCWRGERYDLQLIYIVFTIFMHIMYFVS